LTLVGTERILPAALWVSLMLIYLLGDVLRIFAGDFVAGEIEGRAAASWMWTFAALVMLIPITMIVLSLVVSDPVLRWATVGAAGFLFVFNLAGLPYASFFDNLLIVLGAGVNVLTLWQVWGMTS
jgi:hypothetical protein